MAYYNTTGQTGKTLKANVQKAKTQDQEVYDIMNGTFKRKMSASGIVGQMTCPITSVRRSLNTLMKNGDIKVVGQVQGMYGRQENLYQII